MKTVPNLPSNRPWRWCRRRTLMAGGFGMTGNPVHIVHALAEREIKHLTYICNNVGEPGLGGGRLLRNGQINKAIGSFLPQTPKPSGVRD